MFSDVARSGRKASGRAWASVRQIATASSIAASAASRRPRSARRIDRLFSDGQVGQKGVGPRLGQRAADRHRLLDRRQRRLAPAEVGEAV